MTLANFAVAFGAVATVVHLVTVVIAAFRCRPAHGEPPSRELPPVSLLRPVCGVEPFALETLGSSFRLAYPDYEIIFCVARADDSVVPLVQDLIDDSSEAQARLLIGDERLSPNPKLNNLVKGWEAARHPWIAIVDSNVVLAPDALHRLFARWRMDTGAVSSMPIGSRPANFWAELECAFLNTLQARFQFVMEALGFGFAQGKAMLLRRDLVERAGGLRALAVDLAEDAATTKIVRAAGLRVRLVDEAFEQPLGRRGFGEVWSRQLRWARLRRRSFPWLFLPEILGGCALPAFAIALAAACYDFNILGAAAALLVLWVGAEALLAWRAGWQFSLRMVGALLVRDLLLPVLWIAACAGSSFVWRGTAMQARPKGDPHKLSGFGRRALLPRRIALKMAQARR
jgi:ceramide glucosyltransferase